MKILRNPEYLLAPLAASLLSTHAAAHEAWLLTPAEIETLAKAPVPDLFKSPFWLGLAAFVGFGATSVALRLEAQITSIESKFIVPYASGLTGVWFWYCDFVLQPCSFLLRPEACRDTVLRSGRRPRSSCRTCNSLDMVTLGYWSLLRSWLVCCWRSERLHASLDSDWYYFRQLDWYSLDLNFFRIPHIFLLLA